MVRTLDHEEKIKSARVATTEMNVKFCTQHEYNTICYENFVLGGP